MGGQGPWTQRARRFASYKVLPRSCLWRSSRPARLRANGVRQHTMLAMGHCGPAQFQLTSNPLGAASKHGELKLVAPLGPQRQRDGRSHRAVSGAHALGWRGREQGVPTLWAACMAPLGKESARSPHNMLIASVKGCARLIPPTSHEGRAVSGLINQAQ